MMGINPQKHKSAFTLIELLVVVSIIALLVSILLPALAKARDAAKRAVCSSAQKTIGTACNLYAMDNNGDLPEAYVIYNSRHRLAYHLLLEGNYDLGRKVQVPGYSSIYQGSDVWICPGDKDPIEVTPTTNNFSAWTLPLGKYSFAWNTRIGYRSEATTGGWSPFRYNTYNIDKHSFPGMVAVLRDKADVTYRANGWTFGRDRADLGSNHMNGYNLLLADNHVDWVGPADFNDYIWDPTDGDWYWH